MDEEPTPGQLALGLRNGRVQATKHGRGASSAGSRRVPQLLIAIDRQYELLVRHNVLLLANSRNLSLQLGQPGRQGRALPSQGFRLGVQSLDELLAIVQVLLMPQGGE
jgi:hypothetical protein